MAGKLYMGDRSYGQPILRGDLADVYVGKFCSIAQDVVIDCGWHHNTGFVTTYPLNVFFSDLKHIKGHPVSKGDVVIGNDVWIGEGVIIMGGIRIGDGAVVGAGSIVTRNISPYTIVAGSPAKKIRERFTERQIWDLLEIKWWNWPEEKIIRYGELLMDKDINKFINKVKNESATV